MGKKEWGIRDIGHSEWAKMNGELGEWDNR